MPTSRPPRGGFSHRSKDLRDARSSRSSDREGLLETIHQAFSLSYYVYIYVYIYYMLSRTKHTQPAHTTALNQGTYYQKIYRNTLYASGDEKKKRERKKERERLRGTLRGSVVISKAHAVKKENDAVRGAYLGNHISRDPNTRIVLKKIRAFLLLALFEFETRDSSF